MEQRRLSRAGDAHSDPPAEEETLSTIGNVAFTSAAVVREKTRERFLLAVLLLLVLKIIGAWLLIVVTGASIEDAKEFVQIDGGVTQYVLVAAVGYLFATWERRESRDRAP